MSRRKGTAWTDEQCYAAVTDELNDPQVPSDYPPGWEPMTVEDLDARVVEAAERYARAEGLSWPPAVGDYDRYYERTHQ